MSPISWLSECMWDLVSVPKLGKSFSFFSFLTSWFSKPTEHSTVFSFLYLLSSIKWQVMLSDFGRQKPIKTTAGSVLSLVWRGRAAAREAEEEEIGQTGVSKTGMFISVTPGIKHAYWTWSFPFIGWFDHDWQRNQQINTLLVAEGVWPMVPSCEPIACHGWLGVERK